MPREPKCALLNIHEKTSEKKNAKFWAVQEGRIQRMAVQEPPRPPGPTFRPGPVREREREEETRREERSGAVPRRAHVQHASTQLHCTTLNRRTSSSFCCVFVTATVAVGAHSWDARARKRGIMDLVTSHTVPLGLGCLFLVCFETQKGHREASKVSFGWCRHRYLQLQRSFCDLVQCSQLRESGIGC